MATARLRKAFRYPDQDDSDDNPEDLDEEHQEHLISSLQAEDARKNALYRSLFLAIPLLTAAFFLYSFLAAATAQQRLVAFLSLTSSMCTGYVLQYMPLEQENIRALEKGPLEKYLVWLNAGLAGVLQVAAVVSFGKGEGDEAATRSLAFGVFCLTMWVRGQLRPMDLQELEKARYELKGA